MEGEYDAAARRERYLRERQLKGREKGEGDATSGPRAPAAAAPPKDRSAARAAAAARVKALNGRLTTLRAALQAARKKSADKPSEAEKKSKDEKYNEDYYAKNKTKLANKAKADARAEGGGSKSKSSTPDSPTSGTRSVEELESAIRSTLTQLKSALTKLRSL